MEKVKIILEVNPHIVWLEPSKDAEEEMLRSYAETMIKRIVSGLNQAFYNQVLEVIRLTKEPLDGK